MNDHRTHPLDDPPDRPLDNEPSDEDLRDRERDYVETVQLAPVDKATINLNSAENALRDAYGDEKARELVEPIWECLEVLRP